LPAEEPGSYFLSIGSCSGRSEARSGVNVPYSAEFSTRRSNTQLVRRMAALKPKGGQSGSVIAEPTSAQRLDESLSINVFRRDLMPATSRQDAWPAMLFVAGCLFLLDVFNRRVAVGFTWIGPAIGRLRNRFIAGRADPRSADFIGRLRTRKSQVDDRLDSRHRAARFQGEPSTALDPAWPRETSSGDAQPSATTNEQDLLPPERDDSSYTARLLQAKQRAQKDHKRSSGGPL
jgi:hypothetical protein